MLCCLAAGEWSPLSDNERKDSVSMNVEFVKFNLSRSRKIHVTVVNPIERDSKSFHQNSTEQQQAAIRFSSTMSTCVKSKVFLRKGSKVVNYCFVCPSSYC